MESTSIKYSMNTIDWKKIGVGALMAVIGAVLTYATQVITQIDFGMYTPAVVAGWSIVVNIVRKFLTDHTA